MAFTRFLVKGHWVDGPSTLQFESAFDSFYWGFPEGKPPRLTMVGILQDGLNEYVSEESIILEVKINDRKQSTHPCHAPAGILKDGDIISVIICSGTYPPCLVPK